MRIKGEEEGREKGPEVHTEGARGALRGGGWLTGSSESVTKVFHERSRPFRDEGKKVGVQAVISLREFRG